MHKFRAGVIGAVLAIGILLFQSIESWTVIEHFVDKVRGFGPGTATLVSVLNSHLLTLAIAIASFILILEGLREKKELVPSDGVSSKVDNKAESNPIQTQNASPQITQQVFLGDQKAKAAQEEKEEFASVSFLRARPVLLVQDDFGVWHEATQNFSAARNGIVAPFKNIPKGVGQQTPKANSVTANLVFRSPIEHRII
jgi:hypothetical protein